MVEGKTIRSQCLVCNHFNKNKSWSPLFLCSAFDGGIPIEILKNEHDHTEPYRGDNGIRFEPIETDKQSQDVAGG